MIKRFNNKKKFIIISSTILVLLTGSVYAVNIENESIINDVYNQSLVEDVELPIDVPLFNRTITSPNGEISAEIIREKDMFVDSIIITDKNKEPLKVVLENILYTSIESFSWVDDTRIALCGNVNPSLQVYVVIDASKGEIIDRYDGVGFTWNENKDKLYYVITSPYFSEQRVSDKLVDDNGDVYYETEDGKSMTDVIAFSEDEEDFAFFVHDNNSNERKLLVAKKEKGKKLKIKSESRPSFGKIKFNKDKSLRIED